MCHDVTGLNFLNHKPIPQTSKTENSSTEAKKKAFEIIHFLNLLWVGINRIDRWYNIDCIYNIFLFITIFYYEAVYYVQSTVFYDISCGLYLFTKIGSESFHYLIYQCQCILPFLALHYSHNLVSNTPVLQQYYLTNLVS